MTSAAERLRRDRAARCTAASEPVAREWLDTAVHHPDPTAADAARRAAVGEISVAAAVAAADRADRLIELTTQLATWTPEQARAAAADQGVTLPPPVPAATPFRMSEAGLSAGTEAALRRAGLWSDEQIIDGDAELDAADLTARRRDEP